MANELVAIWEQTYRNGGIGEFALFSSAFLKTFFNKQR
jgi:hypothetical protein